MAKKKRSTSDQQLKATLKELRSDLKASEAKRTSWKKRATKAEATVVDLRTRLKRAERQATKARKKSVALATAPASPPVLSTPAEAPSAQPAAAAPDDTWTVVRLRAEARRRGLTGLSGKTKAELLAALG